MEQVILITQQNQDNEPSRSNAFGQISEVGVLSKIASSAILFTPPSECEVLKQFFETFGVKSVESELLKYKKRYIGDFLPPKNVFELIQTRPEIDVFDNIIIASPIGFASLCRKESLGLPNDFYFLGIFGNDLHERHKTFGYGFRNIFSESSCFLAWDFIRCQKSELKLEDHLYC